MATFDELLAALTDPGDDGVPDTVYDDLRSVYNDDLTTRDAKITELSEANAEHLAEIERLKAKNWDVVSQIQRDGDESENNDPNDAETVEGGIETLFEGEETPEYNY